MNCWEFKRCGREQNGDCPAYPNKGRICWLIAGTLCGGQVQGSFAQKTENCKVCDFYQNCN